MEVTYRVIPMEEAIREQYEDVIRWVGEDTYVEEWESGIWYCEDGRPVKMLAMDGGEPEDNMFIRDGAWIAPALQAAYDSGFKDGGLNQA